MKKATVLFLVMTLMFTLASPCFAESNPGPKTETAIIQADGIPAILAFLNREDQVMVTEAVDEKNCLADTQYGTGTLETQLLRFEGEPEYEVWMGYVGYNTQLFPTYELCGTPVQTLKTNTKIWILEELDECYAVSNAVEELKAIATGVIGSNEEDGVAHWLASHFQKEDFT